MEEEFLADEATAASFLLLPELMVGVDLADDIPLPEANPPVGRAVEPPYLATGR